MTPVQAGKTGKAAHPTSNHGKAEAIYWDARRKADALRWVPPPSMALSLAPNLSPWWCGQLGRP